MTAPRTPAPSPPHIPVPPHTARRRFVTVSVLYWLPVGLTIAPLILLFTERGMALTAIAGFFAAHSLTAAALELPTGGLSDVIGRRTVLAAASTCWAWPPSPCKGWAPPPGCSRSAWR